MRSSVAASGADRPLNAGNEEACCLTRFNDEPRYCFIGPRTISRTASSVSPTKVCSISVT